MTNANSKDVIETKFSGKQDRGLTFEEFDKKALSWARKEYGNSYAKQLWEDTLPDVNNLDLKEDYDYYLFQEHCEYVYDMLCLESCKNADTLYHSAKFWTIKWQLENRQRQYEKLFCFLETICEGEAERQLHAEGVEKTHGMRKHMFERFGSGQPAVLQERVRKYLLGMPDKNGVAFHPRVNMPDKLAQLEQEREYLLRMCPKEKHKDYDEGKETTLVRLILNTLPSEYDDAVHHVRNLMRIREMIKTGDMESITNLDDAVKINYDTSWLPPYKELRVGLINAWTNKKRRWDEQQGSKGKEGHPTMMIMDDPKKDRRCYGCGQLGHMRGADECKAGKDEVWGGAPKAYLVKVQKKFGAVPTSGKRSLASGSRICPYWSQGDGYCKFGDRCHFEHIGPQGGSKMARGFGRSKGKGSSKGKGKGKGNKGGKGKGREKGSRNPGNTTMVVKKKGVKFEDEKDSRVSAMIVGQESKGRGQHEDDESDIEDTLYNLMRGHSSLMIAADSDDSEDESDESENKEDEQEEAKSKEERGRETRETNVRLWGSASPRTSSPEPSYTQEELKIAGPEEIRVWRQPPEWGSTSAKAPTWGNNPLPMNQDQQWAEEWREKGRAQDRKTRDEFISSGGSPPPKLEEENLFSEGSSRKRMKPVYRPKEDITDKKEDRTWNSVEDYTNGRIVRRFVSRGVQASSSSSHLEKEEEEQRKFFTNSYEETSSDESEEDTGEDETDSEGEDRESWSSEDSDDDGKDDGPDGSISQLFGNLLHYRKQELREKKRNLEGKGRPLREEKRETSSSRYKGKDDEEEIHRGDCIMSTTEALYKLTKFEEDKYDEKDEWLIIRVPKNDKRSFFVDFCDGDAEDEFFWMEGPYRSEHLTVEDLLDRRRSQNRSSRRRKGRTQFRDDELKDKRDKDGNRLDIFPCANCRWEGTRILCDDCDQRIFPNLNPAPSGNGLLAANLNEVVKPKTKYRPLKKKKNANSTMMVKVSETRKEAPLHDMTCIGVDTCSARSISCMKEDFLDLEDIVKDDDHLRGIGGSKGVAGKGCLVFYVKDSNGKMKAILEPKGFYLENPPAQFRIIGQQRMKHKGLCATQDYDDEGTDILKCKRSGTILPLTEDRGLLLLKTFPYIPTDELKEQLRGYVNKLRQEKNFLPHVVDLEEMKVGNETVLIMNEANLDKEKFERLMHWRLGHASSKVLKTMKLINKSHLNEDCYCCNQSKFKRAPFPKNEGNFVAVAEPYWRLYIDGYGGQRSLGSESLEGAKGGIICVCPVSGSIILKLYASLKQFPAILYQVLQYVESQGFICREIMVDTFVVNLSEAAEEVAAMFRTRIIPISAGTPQELAFAERAVRTIAEKSRAMLLGAPHLPNSLWGLSDLNAANVHDILPQPERGNKSPFEIRKLRPPNLDHLHIKVFGCPCQFAPIEGPEHKRASKTQWGFFVGMQWPMCLVYDPSSHKVLSVSRKKIICHEGMYAHFDPTTSSTPNTNLTEIDTPRTQNSEEKDINLRSFSKDIDDKFLAAVAIQPPNEKLPSDEEKKLTGVHSIKVLREPEINASMNEALPRPPSSSSHEPSSSPPENQGENLNSILDEDSLREKIDEIKRINREKAESQYDKFKNGIINLRSEKEEQKWSTGKGYGADLNAQNILKERRNLNELKRKCTFQVGDKVRIKTIRFGKKYAKGRPEFTQGKVVKVKGKKAGVVYEGGEEIYDTYLAHLENLGKDLVDEPGDVVATVCYKGKWYKKSQTFYTIMAALEVGSALKRSEESEETNWPKDFFEALVRKDWREWVVAVQKEIESWRTFGASEEVSYEEIERGASIIPLGELYTIKRTGQHKFRQYAMGNLLKAGKDYGDTFSSTVSGDGLRWFCSLAAACNMRIKGWDATTGYLQTKQRIKIYAYLPSHHGFSDMEFEDLAEFRKQLMKIKEKQGIKGVKDFSRQIKKDRRWKPKTVLELKSSTYGIPDAGQAFAMFMQGLHIKKCGLTQCEVDPAIYYRIDEEPTKESKKMKVKDFIIAITWVDDVRYFGTENFVKEYERAVMNNCKCTMEGESQEFVSIDIAQDLENKTLELTQAKYWEKAVERFAEFLPNGKAKERRVPLSAADERMLTEPSEEEVKDAEHLPYPNLLGVIQYPSAFTKPEMRYAMSVLSRHRTKWGKKHFVILIKSLEYGFSTRKKGIIYWGGLRKEDLNVLVAYADSSLSIPRSQGCRMILMNGAVISFTSKRHSTTDDSTAAAELTEQHLCACDVEGLRNLMEEIGLEQMEPTKIYQDNQAAIYIANNRGALAKKTRAMDMRTLAVRNKVEDLKVIPVYCETTQMLADIGTKALDPIRFEILRDAMTGYGMLGALESGNWNQYSSMFIRLAKGKKEEHG